MEWDKSQAITALAAFVLAVLSAIIGGVASGAWY